MNPENLSKMWNELTGKIGKVEKGFSEGARLSENNPEEARLAVKNSLNLTRDHVLEGYAQLNPELNLKSTIQKSEGLSDLLVKSIVEATAQYPSQTDLKGSMDALMGVLNPKKQSDEDKVVSALVLFELFKPYLVDRFVSINWNNETQKQQDLEKIIKDTGLFYAFYQSISPAIELNVEGTSALSSEQIALSLFQIGPLFVKAAQAIPGGSNLFQGKAQSQNGEIGKSFYENIAPPKDDELEEIKRTISPLTLIDSLSSASIAHVVKTKDPTGREWATKVKRTGIKEAIKSNEETYQLLTNVIISYASEHIDKASPLGTQMKDIKEALPFFLTVLTSGIYEELDFVREAADQARAREIFAKHPGIVIPEVNFQLSNGEMITMELIDGAQQIKDLPANREYLKQIAILVIESWKNKFGHGDMHRGNMKGKKEGQLVALDWGKTLKDLPPSFFKKMGMFAAAVGNNVGSADWRAKQIAKAYCRIQSPDYYQIIPEEALPIIANALRVYEDQKKRQEIVRSDDSHHPEKLRQKIKLVESILFSLGMHKQTVMDMRYYTFFKTNLQLYTVLWDELNKQEYEGTHYRTLRWAFVQALKEVYIPHS
ncbi:MAG: AarF/UbiB family protein [bacterium]|nr:AarF/UbiB family protein [bacterium]